MARWPRSVRQFEPWPAGTAGSRFKSVTVSAQTGPAELADSAVDAGMADPALESLRGQVMQGVKWSVISVGAMQVSRIAAGLVLARLLTPRDYGLAGMAFVFSSLVLTVSDLSLGAGLVQRKEITEKDRSTVFWTSMLIGTTLMTLGILFAGQVASFYGQPSVKPLFQVVSIAFLLPALQVTQASIMQRAMRLKALNVRVAAGAIVGSAVGIAAAAMGAGAWALVVQQLSAGAISTILLWWFSSWRPRFVYSLTSLRSLGGFGLNLFGKSVLDYTNRNADNVLVGRFLGAASLGAYTVAYNLMTLPLERLILPIQDALYPAYSRWQDDKEKLRDVWLRVLQMITAVVAPAMLGLVIIAPDFVHVILGEKWHAAIPVLQVLAVVGLIQSLASTGGRLLQALDRTRVIFRMSVLECAVTVPAFAIGLNWGIVGVAVCYAVVTIPVQLLLIRITTRAVGISAPDLGRTLAGPLQAALGMALICWLTRLALMHAGVSPAWRLVAAIAIGAATYTLLCSWRAPALAEEIRSLLRRRAEMRAASAALSPTA